MTDIYMLRELEQIRAIADPLRLKILHALSEQSMTTKQVAERLGENVNKLYHHVETLESVGLIKLTGTKQNRGTLEKYYQAIAKHFTLSPVLFEVRLDADDARSSTTELTFSSALQATLTELKESLRKRLIKPAASHPFFRRLHIRTSREKAAKLQAQFEEWIAECEKAHQENGERLYGVTATFYPVAEPKQRD
ncbi:MAG: helix-turn-helix domain-containing protein [Chloroherpetonaceae bacterium]|nr:helix-turn-helix domain-containing protein [Chloroherpetonaceae bacterium]MDW8437375.1 helix-turn-helix domain-containing protein [Chloroherpetonaceae bacterium]